MENNELMNYEDIEIVDLPVEEGKSAGMSTGTAMLIGAGLACAIGACWKMGKKWIAARKAKKELRQANQEVLVDEENIEAVVDN